MAALAPLFPSLALPSLPTHTHKHIYLQYFENTPPPQAVVDLVREYNALGRNTLAIMLDTKGPEVSLR